MLKNSISLIIVVILVGYLTDVYGCSSVCLNKKGQLILGNNMDWISGDGLVVVNKRNIVKHGFWYANKPEWTWTSKYGSISLNTEGREFPIRGMNEAGLVIAEMMLTETRLPPADNLPVLSGSQWIQYQLDKSATVKDVIASQSLVRIEPSDWAGMASHFLLCDSTGAVAGIEWLNGQMIVYSDSTLPIPAMVNSTYESCILNGNDPSGRFKPIAELYAAYDTAKTTDGISYLFSILQAATVVNSMLPTQWSWAFDVHARRFYWKTTVNNQLQYCDLKDFDFSGKTKVEVLDINNRDTGNVRHAFSPYTTEINRELVTKIYSTYNQYSSYLGRTYPQDTIEGIINFPESTIYKGESNIRTLSHNFNSTGCRLYSTPKSRDVKILLETQFDNIAVSVYDTHGRMVASFITHSAQGAQNEFFWRSPSLIADGSYLFKVAAGKNLFIQHVNLLQ
jgi:choloylglycine hydrolase